MDKLQEMKDYVKQTQLRKVFLGGYSKEDVHLKFDMLMAMIDNYVKNQTEKEAALQAEFETQLTEMQKDFENKKRVTELLIVDLNKSIAEITSQNQVMGEEQSKLREADDTLTAENEQYKVKEAYKRYCSQLIKQYSESIESLSGEFNKMLDNISNIQKNISEDSVIQGLDKALEMLGERE